MGLYQYLYKISLRSCSGIICVSEKIYAQLSPRLLRGNRSCRIINNGIDTDRVNLLASTDIDAAFLQTIKRYECIFTLVGRLSYEKAVDRALIALSQLIHEQGVSLGLLIIGDGPEKDNLQDKARSLGIADAVIFIGFQQNPLAYMKHCDGLLIPSRSEGLPITLLEAMVLGMPIIATNVGSIAQTLNGLDYGLVIDAHDDEAVIACLKNSMLRIMHDGKNERFSANMQDKVKRQYSCRSMEGQYNDFYCSLALD